MGDVCLITESMEENGWCPGGQMPGSVIAWDLVRVVNLAGSGKGGEPCTLVISLRLPERG